MSDIRYLLDENMSPVVQEQLLWHEPSMAVLRIGDEGAPALGAPDSMILKWIDCFWYLPEYRLISG